MALFNENVVFLQNRDIIKVLNAFNGKNCGSLSQFFCLLLRDTREVLLPQNKFVASVGCASAMSKRVLPLLSAGTIVAENLTFFIMIDTTQLTQFISAVVISIPI